MKSSYQKLKSKCDYLQRQVDIFKGALTIYGAPPETITIEDGSISFQERIFIQRNKLFDEQIKQELNRWVAFNLDKESVLKLLEIKEKMKND